MFHQEFTINYYSCPRAQKHEAGHMGATTTTTSNLSAGEEKKRFNAGTKWFCTENI